MRPTNARPAAKFDVSGGIRVAVWKEKSELGFDRYTIRADRTYKDDKDGEFKQTHYLRDGDLLRLSQLLIEADQWIEQDKGKHRGATSQSAVI